MKLNLSIMRTLQNWQSAPIEQEPSRPIAEVVAEIHETFYTEVDRLLEYSKHLNIIESPIQEQLDKSRVLWDLGFNACREVVETQEEHVRINHLQTDNKQKDKLQRAITHFSFKYPNYKFITEESVSKICQKYGLIYGPSSQYIGSIPDKNIKDIQNFSVSQEDRAMIIHLDHCYSYCIYKQKEAGREFHYSGEGVNRRGIYGTEIEFNQILQEHKDKDLDAGHEPWVQYAPFEIAAPPSDFDQKWHKVVGSQLVANYPDPVVLQPVIFEGKKHYLIVTAWGPEASDELVVNQKMN